MALDGLHLERIEPPIARQLIGALSSGALDLVDEIGEAAREPIDGSYLVALRNLVDRLNRERVTLRDAD